MHKRCVGDVLAPIRARIKVVVAEPLDVFAQGRRQGALFGGALAVGETHGRMRIANVQRPHMGNDVAPRSNFNLDPQAR